MQAVKITDYAEPKKLLLAERDEQLRRRISSALRGDGYIVLEASTQDELLNLLGDKELLEFGLVICNTTLSGVYIGAQCTIPVIALTPSDDELTHAAARKVGARFVFNKSFEMYDLRTAVQYLLK